jgi:hypothetical protein
MILDPTPATAGETPPPLWMKWIGDVFDSIRYRWDRYVVDLTLRDQFRMASTIRERGAIAGRRIGRLPAQSAVLLKSLMRRPGLVMAVILALALYFLWIRKGSGGRDPAGARARKSSRVIKEYMRLLKEVEKKGLKRGPSETLFELSERIARLSLPYARIFREATDVYLEVRFGRAPIEAEAILAIRRALKHTAGRRTRTN